jgi:hypothetical protein
MHGGFRPRRGAVLGAIIPVAALAAGCEAPPVVRPVAVSVADASDEAVQLAVDVDIRNPPGNASLRLLRWKYSFSLGGVTAYSGEWEAISTLPAGEVIRRRIPVVVTRDQLERSGGNAAAWRCWGELGYRDPSRFGEILYELGYRPASGFSEAGESALAAPAPAAR